MTTTPTLETVPTPAPTASPTAARPVSSRIVRTAALALLIGGPASMALHVLWRLGPSTLTRTCAMARGYWRWTPWARLITGLSSDTRAPPTAAAGARRIPACATRLDRPWRHGHLNSAGSNGRQHPRTVREGA